MEIPPGAIVPAENGCRLACLATPRASRPALAGWYDGRLKVMLAAPPVDGAANAALTAYLAEALGLPKRSVRIVSGETSRRKVVMVENVNETALAAKLAEVLK